MRQHIISAPKRARFRSAELSFLPHQCYPLLPLRQRRTPWSKLKTVRPLRTCAVAKGFQGGMDGRSEEGSKCGPTRQVSSRPATLGLYLRALCGQPLLDMQTSCPIVCLVGPEFFFEVERNRTIPIQALSSYPWMTIPTMTMTTTTTDNNRYHYPLDPQSLPLPLFEDLNPD